ncbi:MAG TPA: DUF4426 domain-containing protein [Cellvibrionaceae bacterium]
MARYGLVMGVGSFVNRGVIQALIAVVSLTAVLRAQAFPQGEITLGNYQLLYSAINSTLLPAEMATAYGLKRKADEVLVNISVQDINTHKAVPVGIKGVAKNLIQQSRPLVFREIKEADAIYYIATLRTTEREVFHFLLDVTLPDGKVEKATFTQELFVNP